MTKLKTAVNYPVSALSISVKNASTILTTQFVSFCLFPFSY